MINGNNELDNNKVGEYGDDTTRYGEFITTYFAWVPLEEQKKKVERLQKITKKEDKRSDKVKKR